MSSDNRTSDIAGMRTERKPSDIYRAMIGREVKMVELKKELDDLKK